LLTTVFISSTTSKALSDWKFGKAVFSPVKLAVSSSRTDPSQPCHSSHACMSIS